ncbi:Heterokaryon incompatibility protein [Rutstroemia sp. NJR-2017a BBW]|nr:Heterokaryon incompatibility protein [Rutstroemia sp. NJR-2017a BBW]
MTLTRLIDMDTGALEAYSVDAMPPYLATSHAWADGMFAANIEFNQTLGGKMMQNSVRSLFPGIKYCWTDTVCIDQNDEEDKQRQIPVMGDIYGNAHAVVIVTTCDFPAWMTQTYLDHLTEDLSEAIAMHLEEDLSESMASYWRYDEGRKKIVEGMDCLEFFTRTRWADRIWTLQEYILAQKIVWLGQNDSCLCIDDILFRALPELCDTFDIWEAIGGKYSKLYKFYTGMVNARSGHIDRTRIMELLGNRTASFPDDEIYGAMAASGVVVQPGKVTGQDNVWRLWWEEAVRQGNHRWLFLPPVLDKGSNLGITSLNCIMPHFKTRHQSSQYAGLDKVRVQTGEVVLHNGGIKITGRWAGSCRIVQRLGKVYQDNQNNLHRDITLIMFAKGSWKTALLIVAALGGGRYSWKQILALAQILKANYSAVTAAVSALKGRKIVLQRMTDYQRAIWEDFMYLAMSQMLPMNDGVAYLAEIKNELKTTTVIVVTDDRQPVLNLHAFDFGVTNVSDRTTFMVVAMPKPRINRAGVATGHLGVLHKVGMTVPTLVCKSLRKAQVYKCHKISRRLLSLEIGGEDCWFCSKLNSVPA